MLTLYHGSVAPGRRVYTASSGADSKQCVYFAVFFPGKGIACTGASLLLLVFVDGIFINGAFCVVGFIAAWERKGRRTCSLLADGGREY
jgi:hypothetical protein